MDATSSENLPAALEKFSVELPAESIERLDRYCRLLWDWNEKLNLTRHTDYDKFVSRDLIDSLQLASLLQMNEEVLDVGTGGGVPGIVLAILRPDLQVSLSESVHKKVHALTEMAEQLDVSVGIHPCRAEEVLKDLRFHSLVARAVGPLERMLKWFEPHWLSFDRLLAIKGPRWTQELEEAKRLGLIRKLEVNKVAEYDMPGTESRSVILEVRPVR